MTFFNIIHVHGVSTYFAYGILKITKCLICFFAVSCTKMNNVEYFNSIIGIPITLVFLDC